MSFWSVQPSSGRWPSKAASDLIIRRIPNLPNLTKDMMRNFLLIFITFASCLSALPEMNTKEAIRKQQEAVDLASSEEKGEELADLAELYLKDQDQEKAFKVFLDALQFAGRKTPPEFHSEEDYKKAFSIYVSQPSEAPQEVAVNLIEMLKPILQEKPDQYLLDYFVAIANANLGRYDQFFKHFLKAFQFYPDHYLAYKTKAVLHIKLLERTRENHEREIQREEIRKNLLLALEREPYDTTIYKLLISFSPKEKKREQVQLCLKKILDANIMVPRNDVMFYVLEAVDANEIEWCQRFISRSKEWYPQSRLVASAQEYLNRRL